MDFRRPGRHRVRGQGLNEREFSAQRNPLPHTASYNPTLNPSRMFQKYPRDPYTARITPESNNPYTTRTPRLTETGTGFHKEGLSVMPVRVQAREGYATCARGRGKAPGGKVFELPHS